MPFGGELNFFLINVMTGTKQSFNSYPDDSNVCESVVLKNKCIHPEGSYGLFLTCGKNGVS